MTPQVYNARLNLLRFTRKTNYNYNKGKTLIKSHNHVENKEEP